LGVSKDEVTFGAFVGVATVKEIRPFSRTDHNQLMDKGGDTRGYRPNQHAWVLEGIHRLDKPIRFRGMLGLFNPPKRAIDAAQRAIAKANRIAAKAVRNRKVLAANAGH
jgi:hypothetical protein